MRCMGLQTLRLNHLLDGGIRMSRLKHDTNVSTTVSVTVLTTRFLRIFITWYRKWSSGCTKMCACRFKRRPIDLFNSAKRVSILINNNSICLAYCLPVGLGLLYVVATQGEDLRHDRHSGKTAKDPTGWLIQWGWRFWNKYLYTVWEFYTYICKHCIFIVCMPANSQWVW